MENKMNKFYTAALSHWKSQRDEALATLELYFQKSMIGLQNYLRLMKI